MKNKKTSNKRKRVLLVSNIVVAVGLFILSIILMIMTRGNAFVLIFTIFYEVMFIILSLIVYYLSIIAHSVSKIADSAIQENEKDN